MVVIDPNLKCKHHWTNNIHNNKHEYSISTLTGECDGCLFKVIAPILFLLKGFVTGYPWSPGDIFETVCLCACLCVYVCGFLGV